MSLFHLLFGFSGRINRGKYWLAVVLWLVFWVIALPVCLLAGFAILGTNLVDGQLPSGDDWLEKSVRMAVDYVVLFIIFLTLVIVSWISAFAIGIKRLHDRNKNGWLIVLFYVAPSILAGIANTSEHAVASSLLGLASFGHLDLGPGGAWLPARDCRPQPVWARSTASARRRRRVHCARIRRSVNASAVRARRAASRATVTRSRSAAMW